MSVKNPASRALSQVTRGMNGFLLPCVGDANPSVVPAPYELGADITANNVVTAAFRNPPHQKHVARCIYPARLCHTVHIARASAWAREWATVHTARSVGVASLIFSGVRI